MSWDDRLNICVSQFNEIVDGDDKATTWKYFLSSMAKTTVRVSSKMLSVWEIFSSPSLPDAHIVAVDDNGSTILVAQWH